MYVKLFVNRVQNKLQLEFEHWYLNFTAMIIGILQFKYCKKNIQQTIDKPNPSTS